MRIFSKKEELDLEDEETLEEEKSVKKIRDLRPENKKKGQEPIKP